MNRFKSTRVCAAFCLSVVLGLIGSSGHCAAQQLTPSQSVAAMSALPGMEVRLVASEPLVRQPVCIEHDDRGRLWVIQYLQYPNPEGLTRVAVDRFSRTRYDRVPEPPPDGPKGADRITILKDSDGDAFTAKWWQFNNYKNAPVLVFSNSQSLKTTIEIPKDSQTNQTLYLVLEVVDNGRINMTSYQTVKIIL